MRKWLGNICGEISLVFMWLCGTLDPDKAVENITWEMDQITIAAEKEKKRNEVAEQQARYQIAVERGINGR